MSGIIDMCRLCTGSTELGVCLLEASQNENLSEITTSLNIEINEHNGFPTRICYYCLVGVRNWMALKVKCQAAHQIFCDSLTLPATSGLHSLCVPVFGRSQSEDEVEQKFQPNDGLTQETDCCNRSPASREDPANDLGLSNDGDEIHENKIHLSNSSNGSVHFVASEYNGDSSSGGDPSDNEENLAMNDNPVPLVHFYTPETLPLPVLSDTVRLGISRGHTLFVRRKLVKEYAEYFQAHFPFNSEAHRWHVYAQRICQEIPELMDVNSTKPYAALAVSLNRVIRNKRYTEKKKRRLIQTKGTDA